MYIFGTTILIGDTIFTSPTGDGTAILRGRPTHESLAVCKAKAVPSFLSYFKTLSFGPAPGIEAATFRSTVQHSTHLANPAALTGSIWWIS